MNKYSRLTFIVYIFVTGLTLLVSPISIASSLSDEYIIKRPGTGDQNFLEQQHQLASQLVYDALLRRMNGDKEHDLGLLQKLLDGKHVKAHQRRELQALGVVLGRFLEKEFRMKWVIYIDSVGRSRGLQVGNTRQVIFPLTMISRRVEADARADVKAIYDKASNIVRYTLDNKPLFMD